ncbi:acetyltransferase GNAT family [Pseudohyphozyma bogoriensis]|nr:acetyltransferase GNAT family [Pseudohyphozyma bogoriensis]
MEDPDEAMTLLKGVGLDLATVLLLKRKVLAAAATNCQVGTSQVKADQKLGDGLTGTPTAKTAAAESLRKEEEWWMPNSLRAGAAGIEGQKKLALEKENRRILLSFFVEDRESGKRARENPWVEDAVTAGLKAQEKKRRLEHGGKARGERKPSASKEPSGKPPVEAPVASAAATPLSSNAPSASPSSRAATSYFFTESSKIRIDTPRLHNARVFAIKSESVVVKTQCYDLQISPLYTFKAFTSTYIYANLPHLPHPLRIPGLEHCRRRYAFAIEPKKNKDGNPVILAKKVEGVKDLDAEGTWFEANFPILTVKRGEVFRYPSVDALASFKATPFYELHPNFWNQHVMSEAVEHALRFCFDVLRLSIVDLDPLVVNTASLKIAEGLGMRLVRVERRGRGEHKIYEVSREEWYQGEKGREGGTKDEPRYEVGEKTCRWCINPAAKAVLKCNKCDWAWWCGEECREKDIAYPKGHGTECTLDASEEKRMD